jgi:hypothetical protein
LVVPLSAIAGWLVAGDLVLWVRTFGSWRPGLYAAYIGNGKRVSSGPRGLGRCEVIPHA